MTCQLQPEIVPVLRVRNRVTAISADTDPDVRSQGVYES